ncbi:MULTISPECIES: transposase family protein [unclassified Gilliamella]|uniref:transposase family protein n=1 Tax=unclassified Gilliamella TaxID=2685620 RepID=UPI001326B227|nr:MULTISPECIES: transposase family protein [unclassified Gilliamella]MWN30872.1 DDE-type integrase/transposase/recombinase [Gilliamella sp. Pra-s60]MWP28563.1 DDE-type integrase/transposase/recombinase [Gilliamella sp. Pra-s54]
MIPNVYLLLKNETKQQTRKYLFVSIGHFSRELYAGIYSNKSQFSSTQFLQNNVLAQCPYIIKCIYSDNRHEYQGPANTYLLKRVIIIVLIKLACPQTNEKAEKSDTNFEMRYGTISKYLAIQ